MFFPGKHAPDAVKILPLDLASGEESLHEAVQKAESLFPDGVHYMVHNAASDRHVSCLSTCMHKTQNDILIFFMLLYIFRIINKL